MNPDSDLELVERFRSGGDESAFDQLVERHRRGVYRLAYRISGNHEDAHDLAQEAFVRVYRGLGGFRGDSAFRTWLYRVVVNLSLNHLRRLRQERSNSVSVDDVVLSVPAQGLGQVLADEDRGRLDAAIGRLPAKQRQTLELKVFHELKYREIAEVMRCSVGTAKANFFHAVQALKRELGLARRGQGTAS
jgi:RNA polymerase sigma-70 factor (ECF subfamily)